jgi:hypothetical protein
MYKVKSPTAAITLNIITVTQHWSITEYVLTLKPTFIVQLFENYPKHIQPLRQEKEVTPAEWGNTDEQQPQRTDSFVKCFVSINACNETNLIVHQVGFITQSVYNL